MEKKIKLRKYALAYLSNYDTSKNHLKKILQKKIRKLSDEKKERVLLYNSINDILVELETKNILNDGNYTDRKITNFILQGKSKIYIEKYLIFKGIEKKIIHYSLENLEVDNPSWELEAAKIFSNKKKLGIDRDQKKLEKDLSKMARAGFNYGIIKKILKLN